MPCVVNKINKLVETAFQRGDMVDTVEITQAEHNWLCTQLQQDKVDEVMTDFGIIKVYIK